MDVDLLRPGTAPISPDAVLWFEFLLDSNLLLTHLEKPKPDPSAVELIIKFTKSILESVKNDKRFEDEQHVIDVSAELKLKPRDSLKNLALKILSLKICAHLKWNLDLLELKLPTKIQMCLLQDLIYFANNKQKVEIPKVSTDIVYSQDSITDQHLFALILYHRWLIRTVVRCSFNLKTSKLNGDIKNEIIPVDDLFSCSPELIMTSVEFLESILSLTRPLKVPTFETFVMLNENTKEVEQNWNKCIECVVDEAHSQIFYDLGCFYFQREEYNLAKQYFLKCSDCFYSLNSPQTFVYASFDLNSLNGFLYACNVTIPGFMPSLLNQLNASIVNQYTGILSILQEDNVAREIPIMYRIILELDIQGALSSGKFTVARDLLLQVQMLNVVRLVLDKETSQIGDFVHRLKYGGQKAIDIFFWAIFSVLESCNKDDEQTLKDFLVRLFMKENIPELSDKFLLEPTVATLFTTEDIDLISKAQIKNDDVVIPDSLKTTDWLSFPDFSPRRNPVLETKVIEQRLITTYDVQSIRDLLTKYLATNLSRPVWRLNSCWELPVPLQSIVMSMPRGFLQDFSFILLVKSNELLGICNFNASIQLLNVLENEIHNSNLSTIIIHKFEKLIHWEVLLVEIEQLFNNWSGHNLNKPELISKCRACLSCLETGGGDSVIPRAEIIEQSALYLLNLGDWEYLCGLDKRWNYFEMAAAVAYACQDLTKFKGAVKVSRDMWNLVLPIFGPNSNQIKRSTSGNATTLHRDSSTIITKANLMSFLANLRELTTLNIVISMFARLYNVLKDESNLELNVDYIVLWPALVSNANSYNINIVCEVLLFTTLQALKYFPKNLSWLKLLADINYGNGNYDTSLKHYIEMLMIGTDYFNQPICKPLANDLVFKRMIKCCTQTNCFTQAAILYQFLDDIDYGLAFKCLAENKSANCCDAIDTYYNCIWDTTFLEYLVHLHNKRGETHRKQQAVKAMGMLELNSNNNGEIQREAMNIRKARFLRALAKQYLTINLKT